MTKQRDIVKVQMAELKKIKCVIKNTLEKWQTRSPKPMFLYKYIEKQQKSG